MTAPDSAAPTHKLALTNGATVELANLVQTRGLLTKPALIRRVGKFAKKHLRDLPRECREVAEMADWSDEQFLEAEIGEQWRDAIKALVKSAAEKGVLPATPGAAHLLEVLGLADDEG